MGTALATGVLAGLLLVPRPADAAGECGVASPAAGTVTCTSVTGVGNPYPNGIGYVPSGDLTLVLDPTVVVTNNNNSIFAVSHAFGVAVPPPPPPNVAPLGAAAPDFNVTINISGSPGGGAHITTTGYKSPGVYGAVNTTTLTINNAGTIVTSGYQSVGVIGRSFSGAVVITNSAGGSITTGNTFSHGIYGYSNSGSVGITNNGSISNTGNTSTGVSGVVQAGSGALSITNNGTIVSGTAASSYNVGISANSGSSGAITITNSATGSIVTQGDHGSDGIKIPSYSSNSLVVITNAGSITTQGLNTANAGGNIGVNVYSGGTVTVTNTSTGTISTAADISAGISVYGATTTVSNAGNIITQGPSSNGITANGSTGPVTVMNSGNITTQGDGSRGIVGTSQGNNVVISNDGSINVLGASGRGISGVTYGTSSLTIDNAGTIKTYGANTFGIRANNVGGTGLITINSTGTVKTYGAGATGITTPAVASNIAITANNVQAFGANASAISITTSGTAALNTTGTIFGTLSGITVNAGGGASLANSGNISAANAQALVFSGGAATIQNSGVVTGDVILGGAGGNAFNNLAGGLFNMGTNVTLGVGNTLTNSGTITPGGAGTVATTALTGNLTFTSGGTYLVTINGANASRINVSGTTAPGGASVSVAGGSQIVVNQQYTILTAAGGVNGTFNPNVNFGIFTGTLSYDPNDVFLTFKISKLQPLLPPGSGVNANNVAAALDNFTANGSTPPAGFLNLFNLTPPQLANALAQLSGENNTGTERASVLLMNQYLSLLLNPLADNRGGGFGPAIGFAPERQGFPPDVAAAYASVLKAPPAQVSAAPRLDVWAAAFGGSNRTDGDPTGTGSHDTTTRAGGFAAGLDYRVSPDTLVGFSLAGGATSWGLANGLGGGRSDAFLAGLYGSQRFGQAYLSGALASANYWASTNRTVTVAGTDQLTASFDAQSFAGRLEAGYRVVMAPFNLTPYAAIQAQSFKAPSYSETAVAGSPQFALSYNAQNETAVRAELGSWINKTFAFASGEALALFGRAAWAHDRNSNPSLTPTFLGLPTVSFVVNGATPPQDLALLTAGAELRMSNGWSMMARFDGEFGQGSQTYTGTARLRYTW